MADINNNNHLENLEFIDPPKRSIPKFKEADRHVNHCSMGREADRVSHAMFKIDHLQAHSRENFKPEYLKWLFIATVYQTTLGFTRGVEMELVERKCLYGTECSKKQFFYGAVQIFDPKNVLQSIAFRK